MRILVAVIAATLALGTLPAPAALADTSPDVRETAPDARALSREEQLDALFESLAAARSKEEAKAAEDGILRLWMNSGSDTVDLLMEWTLAAMDEENYPLALDLLDRIVTLEPAYVEAWNKRATVHFMNDDYGKSLADLERVLALEPRHFAALAGLGTILADLGDEKRALEAYRQALALDPYLDDVQEAIDELEDESGDRRI